MLMPVFSSSVRKFSFAFFTLAFFLSFFHEAFAAHTFDTFAQSTLQTTNPATLSYTAGSGTTVLVVMLAHTQASRTGGAPTYNGITMSQVDGEVLNAQEVGVEMWYLIDPPTGSAYTISVPNTGAGNIRIYGASFKAQSGYTSALDVSNTTNVDAANPSLALTTTVNGAAVIDILADGDPDVPTARSHTLIGSADEGQRANEAQYALQATAGLITLSHTIPSDDVAMIAAAFKEVAKTTTLGGGTDPSNASLAPGGAATMADAFTFQTNTGTDSITAAVVGLASGTSGGLSLVEITNDAGSVVYGSVANPVSDTPSITLSGLTATTVSTQYKIRVTPKSHANMPAPPGSTYSVTAKINSFTGTNSQAGSDTSGTTVTVDNASPSATTGASATGGDTQVTVSWTNPTGDFSNIVVLRDTATIGSGSTPAEGTSPTVGSSCGGTACQVRYISTGTSFIDTGLTNGTTYYYRLFPKDTSGNYTAYASTEQVSAAPSAVAVNFTITSSAGANGAITPLGAISIAQGADQTFTITPNTGYNINTLVVDSVSIATSTSYTFTNVQATHTIETTFIAIPTPPGSFSIAATAGSGGSISPSGLITVTQGDSQAFTITPDTGYNINTLVVDSVSIATSTSYTFTNVQANHTIAVTFATPEAVAPAARRILRPITVTFSGKAFPLGNISIVDKEIASGKMTSRDFIAHLDGAFYISFVDIIEGTHTFGILAKDKNGRSTQSKFYTLELSAHQLEERNILLPPTIDLVRGQVSRGKNATVIGSASPDSTLRIEINGILTKEISTETNGSYYAEIPTGILEFGTYKIRARQYDRRSTLTSDYSPLRSLIVSRLVTTEADFSGDGKIDIQDWSIFLSRWTSKEAVLKQSLDLNGDGKVSIADFSIFIRTIRRK